MPIQTNTHWESLVSDLISLVSIWLLLLLTQLKALYHAKVVSALVVMVTIHFFPPIVVIDCNTITAAIFSASFVVVAIV